jgi:hypothetical protein
MTLPKRLPVLVKLTEQLLDFSNGLSLNPHELEIAFLDTFGVNSKS